MGNIGFIDDGSNKTNDSKTIRTTNHEITLKTSLDKHLSSEVRRIDRIGEIGEYHCHASQMMGSSMTITFIKTPENDIWYPTSMKHTVPAKVGSISTEKIE